MLLPIEKFYVHLFSKWRVLYFKNSSLELWGKLPFVYGMRIPPCWWIIKVRSASWGRGVSVALFCRQSWHSTLALRSIGVQFSKFSSNVRNILCLLILGKMCSAPQNLGGGDHLWIINKELTFIICAFLLVKLKRSWPTSNTFCEY